MTKSSCVQILRKIQSKEILTDELGKAKSFRLFSIARPFMRSFHASWFGFFVAFTSWFGIQPLLPTIRKELGLTKVDLAYSGVASIAATIAVRVIIGLLCDRFGSRRVMASLLLSGAIPMALAGLVRNATGLIILRLCVGVLGGTFVPCQFWTTTMFNVKVIGTANAMVGGWGNLGGGFTFLLMPGIFELVKICGANEFLAWKIAVAVPAFICIVTGISILFTTDDCPQGNWNNRILPNIKLNQEIIIPEPSEDSKPHGIDNAAFSSSDRTDTNGNKSSTPYIIPALDNDHGHKLDFPDMTSTDPGCSCSSNGWTYITIAILVIQYGMCFGVEISVNTVMNLYFLYKFKIEGCIGNEPSLELNSTMPALNESIASSLNTTFSPVVTTSSADFNKCSILNQNQASLITSLFGLMNLFARALGGIFSDVLRKYHAIPGRLLALSLCLLVEGIMLIIFSLITTIPSAIAVMIVISVFVQMSEGATFAIVPYVLLRRVGIVAGLVGAGGNAGGLIWNTIWSQLVTVDPSRYFWVLGICVVCGSLLSFLSVVQGARLWHICKRQKPNY